jgi:hypothetical protein
MVFASMIVRDLYVIGMGLFPSEAYPPSVVNANAVLAFPVAHQGLKPVTWWGLQILEIIGLVQIDQFPPCVSLNSGRQLSRNFTATNLLGLLIGEAF